jgi:hypothetical protein
MNKLLYHFIFLFAGAMLCGGCYKDKSNTSFSLVNKVTITDAATATLISVLQGDTLKLAPVIAQSLLKDEQNLKYEWKIYDNSPTTDLNAPMKVIAVSRNLKTVIQEPFFTLGANYRLTYTVKDTLSGISTAAYYNLSVTNKFREGWVLLEEKGAGADLAMILPDEEIVKNVYSDRNAATPLGKPVRLEVFNYAVDDALMRGKRMYVLAESGGVSINPVTMVKAFDYKDLFFNTPATLKPQILNWVLYRYGTTSEANMGIAINDGKVHVNQIGGFPGVKKWGNYLLTPDGSLNYRAAPFLVGGDTYLPAYPAVIYDQIGKRFYYAGTNTLRAFAASTSTEFDLNNVGMDMLYMDSTNVFGQFLAIMKDASNTPYLLGFKTSSTVAAPALTLKKQQISDVGILQLQTAVASTLTPHLYYSVDNKIYKYETSSNTTATGYSFGSGETVTQMKFQRIAKAGVPLLVVATWNGTEGKLYHFPVDVSGNISTYSKVYTGFAKIKDFGYKLP